MHGHHARPSMKTLFTAASTDRPPPPGRFGARASLRTRLTAKVTGPLHRRYTAHRSIAFQSTHLPGNSGAGEEECLLLVHVRRVVGRVHYRICVDCAQGVISAVTLEERFRRTGLGHRALAHLRFRHPGIAWHSTLSLRTTRALLRRMPLPAAPDTPCAHAQRPLPAPIHTV
ncbi:hypothetical protein [Streptomyces sp. NPDC091268]|uniref:hypothetical protein n=1 Tax=Streptomyces sp. NPDC091268 TaxID=3365979 RepID=UPI003804EBDE